MFVVTTRSGSAPANSVSLVVLLSHGPPPTNRLSSALEHLLATYPADFEIVCVCQSGKHEKLVQVEPLAQNHPLRMHLVRIDRPSDTDGAMMEGLVKARGRTIVLLKDAAPESLARFEALLASLFRVACRRHGRRRTQPGTRRGENGPPVRSNREDAQLGAGTALGAA